jgi:hypothetical protein
MPPTIERPLTPDERKDLEALARSGSATRQALQLASFVFAVLLVAGFLVVWIFNIPRAEGRIGFGVVAGLIAARVFSRTRRRFAEISDAAAVKSDLAGGVASESACAVAEAVRVAELGDEGSNYYLKLADGRVMFASGQYLQDFEEKQQFPSTRIVFVRAPRSGTLLDLRCEGTYLAPRAVLPPFDKKRVEEGDIPCDGEIVRLSWEEILAKAVKSG